MIIVTGGSGLLGDSFKKILPNALYPTRNELNLEDLNSTDNFIKNNKDCEAIIHLAAKVGGVNSNSRYISDFYEINSNINNNLIQTCIKYRINKLVCCLSTCIYPDEKYVTYPLSEEQLHNGPPHPSNFGYAYAKRMVDVQLRAARQQYGLNYISVIPNNMYGENDNFDLSDSHVLPALIRKIWEAKIHNKPSFDVWGDGEVYREFTYSQDIAKTILFCADNYNQPEPINIGNTKEYKLKDVIEIVCKHMEYHGKINYDIHKPKGQIRKPTSNQKLINLGWDVNNYISLEKGLKNTCDWFILNYPNIRGIK
jgi:GDP-L-fucose synthase